MDIDLIVELIIKLLGVLNPSSLDQIKKKIKQLEEQHVKDKEEALAAIESGDVAALNRIISRLLDMSET